MSEINCILNDESNNDKELVKELSIYIKNHRDKKLPINRKFIEDIVSIILRNSEIICNGVILVNDENYIAYWDREYKCPAFNLTRSINEIKRFKKNRFKSKSSYYETINYYMILRHIIHELTHARQEYILEHQGSEIYSSFYELLDTNYECYSQHHNEILAERYANLRSSILAYQALSYIYNSKYIKKLKYDTLNYLLCGYKIDNTNKQVVSAFDNYNSLLEENSIEGINIQSNEDMTLYDRLYLGFPISTSEYHKLRLLDIDDVCYNDEKTQTTKILINNYK